jgi:hypothetical protein
MTAVFKVKHFAKQTPETAAICMAGDNSSRNVISMQTNLQEPELCAGNENLILIN